MNSAKKISNKQNEEGKPKASAARGDRTVSDGGFSDTKRIVVGAICAVVVLALCIGVAIQQLKPKVVLTVDDNKHTMDDMMYPIYERESQYIQYDQMYQMYMGQSVWEASYMGSDRQVSSSASNAEGLKQEIINSETSYDVLYAEAQKESYELDDSDKSAVKEEVEKALKGLSLSQKLKLNISESKLMKRFEKRKLADKYKNAQEEVLNATVDEKAAIKDISKKDYREYKIQYYSYSGTTTDDEGNSKKRSDKEKKELYKKLEELNKKAASAKDFTKLLGDDDKEEADSDISYAETSFTEKDGWSMVTTKKLLDQIKGMKNKEISGIIEDEKTGYTLFVKMIDNNSTDSYDEACDEAIETAQNEAYDKWYQGILKDYDVEVNDEIWDDVEIGTVTTDIVTLEDLQKMQEEDSSDATSEK